MIWFSPDSMPCDDLITRWKRTLLLRSVSPLFLSTDAVILRIIRHSVSSVVPDLCKRAEVIQEPSTRTAGSTWRTFASGHSARISGFDSDAREARLPDQFGTSWENRCADSQPKRSGLMSRTVGFTPYLLYYSGLQ